MIKRVLSSLGLGDENIETERTRRKHHRRAALQSLITVDDKHFVVKNWSTGGVYFDAADECALALGDTFKFKLQFKLPHDTVTVDHQAQVVRSNSRGIAAKFGPITPEIRRRFDRVIDDLLSQSFRESQTAA